MLLLIGGLSGKRPTCLHPLAFLRLKLYCHRKRLQCDKDYPGQYPRSNIVS